MPGIKPIHPRFHLEVLSADGLEAIKSATLHILEHVGVRFPSERARRIFAGHGAQVDMESQGDRWRQGEDAGPAAFFRLDLQQLPPLGQDKDGIEAAMVYAEAGIIRRRARAEFDRILAEHEPERLEEAAQAELRAILDAAEREQGD